MDNNKPACKDHQGNRQNIQRKQDSLSPTTVGCLFVPWSLAPRQRHHPRGGPLLGFNSVTAVGLQPDAVVTRKAYVEVDLDRLAH